MWLEWNIILDHGSISIKNYNKAFKLLERCYKKASGSVTFYDLHKICKILKISAPNLNGVLKKLEERGYFASRTHIKPTEIRTDAPLKVLKEIILSLK